MKKISAMLSEEFKVRHRWTWWRLKRIVVRPALPRNPDGKVYLHLGCGRVNDPRFINIDALPWPHVHYLGGVERLPMFGNESADFIYLSHCLEHISFREVPKVLGEWYRVLRPGGRLRLSVPDFDLLIAMYQGSGCQVEPVEPPLLGGQSDAYDFHKSLYNRARLEGLLQAAGFTDTREWQPDEDEFSRFDDWSRKGLTVDGKKYLVSLNLEGTKR